jgi:DNA-binding XRE family transcriptional regulator
LENIEENLVKKTCRELGITQKELAIKVGVSNTTISDWNNYRTPIPKWAKNSMFMLVELKEFQAIKKSFQKLSNSDMQIRISPIL